MIPSIGCAAHKPTHLPDVAYRVIVHPSQCKLQPDGAYICSWVRLDPREVRVPR